MNCDQLQRLWERAQAFRSTHPSNVSQRRAVDDIAYWNARVGGVLKGSRPAVAAQALGILRILGRGRQ